MIVKITFYNLRMNIVILINSKLILNEWHFRLIGFCNTIYIIINFKTSSTDSPTIQFCAIKTLITLLYTIIIIDYTKIISKLFGFSFVIYIFDFTVNHFPSLSYYYIHAHFLLIFRQHTNCLFLLSALLLYSCIEMEENKILTFHQRKL